jgi:hypothetical protein
LELALEIAGRSRSSFSGFRRFRGRSFALSANLNLACSPKSDSFAMRVSRAREGKTILAEKHRPEQISKKLREAEAMIAAGSSIGQVCQAL